MKYRTYPVRGDQKEPLLAFVLEALRGRGCRIIKHTPADEAPFRVSFETLAGERLGLLCYAFLANQKLTKNRPADEHRFQIKYGPDDKRWHPIFRDPFGLYTTLFLGINPDLGLFVAADPAMHDPTRFFISLEFKQAHVDEILSSGWHAWERDKRDHPMAEPVEVLVGGKKDRFLDLVQLERLGGGLDQGHRQLLAEKIGSRTLVVAPAPAAVMVSAPAQVHRLAQELEMTETQVLDMIASTARLKMAVRGWAAEAHLRKALDKVEGVSDCEPDKEGGADVKLRYEGSRPLTIECKNVLRKVMGDGTIRVDFQRTRSSKKDPCSRYYKPSDFDLVAACLHSVTERWEFRYALPGKLDPHKSCAGRISSNVRLDDRWSAEVARMLRAAART